MDLQVVSLYPHDLAMRVAYAFNRPLIVPHIEQLPDSEVILSFPPSCLWENSLVLLIQPTGVPIHDTLVKIALLAEHIKQAGASKIIGVIPYLGYARQLNNDVLGLKSPVQAIIQLLESCPVDEYVLVEPHDKNIKLLFKKPVIDVDVTEIVVQHIKLHMPLDSNCVVAPDKGAFARAHNIAQRIGCPFLVYHKKRINPEEVRILDVQGAYTGKNAIIIDDIFNTGTTAHQVSSDLFARGIHAITGYFIHPVFSNSAYKMIEKSFFQQIFVSNSLPLQHTAPTKVKVFDISDALVKAVTPLLRK